MTDSLALQCATVETCMIACIFHCTFVLWYLVHHYHTCHWPEQSVAVLWNYVWSWWSFRKPLPLLAKLEPHLCHIRVHFETVQSCRHSAISCKSMYHNTTCTYIFSTYSLLVSQPCLYLALRKDPLIPVNKRCWVIWFLLCSPFEVCEQSVLGVSQSLASYY